MLRHRIDRSDTLGTAAQVNRDEPVLPHQNWKSNLMSSHRSGSRDRRRKGGGSAGTDCDGAKEPETIRVDNDPEFVSKVSDQWAYRNGVTLDFGRSRKPTDNAYVESFNGSLRDECLNANWFLSLEDSRSKIEAWRRHCNETRPHAALGNVPRSEFTSKGGASPALAGSARPVNFTSWLDLRWGDLQ